MVSILVNKETWGNIYKPAETTIPLLNIDPVDLKKLTRLYIIIWCKSKRLYGQNTLMKITDVKVEAGIYHLTNNKFIMFPSTNMYYLTNSQKDSLNFVQTITYEYI